MGLKFYDNWYIACQSQDLGQKPIARTILEIPFVLFRGINGEPTALLDRCPHRNVPLSKGWVKNDRLICKYHGWQFDERGICQEIPGLCTQKEDKSRNAIAYPVIEQDNFIWVYCQAEVEPKSNPYQFPYTQEKGFSTFSWQIECQTSLENAAENFLDGTHTPFVHPGLIWTDDRRQESVVKITRYQNLVEAVYLNDRIVSGWSYKLLAPGCQSVTTISRFILPSIAQLEYKTDKEYKLLVSLCMTPVKKDLVRGYMVVTFKWGLPKWLGRAIARPILAIAMQQDKHILKLQTSNINLFNGENFASTEIDIMRPHILYLLKQAGGDRADESSVFEKTVRLKL